jgi:hypothetical protein
MILSWSRYLLHTASMSEHDLNKIYFEESRIQDMQVKWRSPSTLICICMCPTITHAQSQLHMLTYVRPCRIIGGVKPVIHPARDAVRGSHALTGQSS